MPRNFLKKILPEKHKLQKHKSLQCFGKLLQLYYLWHLNRKSVATGVATGIFWAFMPIPLQMVPATLCAIIFRGNLLVTLVCVWITNPITIPPIFYFTYRLGQLILGRKVVHHQNVPDLLWFIDKAHDIWWPLLVGSLTTGLVFSALGYFVVSQLWRFHIRRSWQQKNIGYRIRGYSAKQTKKK